MEATTKKQSDQSPPKAAQDRRAYSAADSGGTSENMSSKQRSPKKMRHDGKLMESKMSSYTQSHTLTAPGQAPLEETEPTQCKLLLKRLSLHSYAKLHRCAYFLIIIIYVFIFFVHTDTLNL
jgi:hypothetical protein